MLKQQRTNVLRLHVAVAILLLVVERDLHQGRLKGLYAGCARCGLEHRLHGCGQVAAFQRVGLLDPVPRLNRIRGG